MRLSLESSVCSSSGGPGSATNGRQVGSLRHSRSGAGPGFCTTGGGTEYVWTGTRASCSTAFGWLRPRLLVWVIDQTTMLSETPVSVKTALDDMKNSVPPLELLKSRLDGD